MKKTLGRSHPSCPCILAVTLLPGPQPQPTTRAASTPLEWNGGIDRWNGGMSDRTRPSLCGWKYNAAKNNIIPHCPVVGLDKGTDVIRRSGRTTRLIWLASERADHSRWVTLRRSPRCSAHDHNTTTTLPGQSYSDKNKQLSLQLLPHFQDF